LRFDLTSGVAYEITVQKVPSFGAECHENANSTKPLCIYKHSSAFSLSGAISMQSDMAWCE
jgi:hypothetical protein